MEVIQIRTLVDITCTGIVRPGLGTQLELDQHRNFTTLLQCLELRSVISYNQPPIMEHAVINTYGFGYEFRSKHNVWVFTFIPDRTGYYTSDDGNPVGLLLEDLHNVPVVTNLTETGLVPKHIFDTKDARFRNISARIVREDI